MMKLNQDIDDTGCIETKEGKVSRGIKKEQKKN